MSVAKSLFEACLRPTVFCGDWPSLASSSSRRFLTSHHKKRFSKKRAGLLLVYR
jgi:hypothetical protein